MYAGHGRRANKTLTGVSSCPGPGTGVGKMTELDSGRTAKADRRVAVRPLVWDDVDSLVGEFDRTWKVDDPEGGEVSRLSATHFILQYLTETTRGAVATLDGRFMGVTLLGVKGDPVLFDRAADLLPQVDRQLGRTGLGTRFLADAVSWRDTEVALEGQVGLDGPEGAELKLFLVAKEARGHGVGRTLWSDLLDYLAGHRVERFYLHTDSSCDVGYYDHQGMERLAELKSGDYPDFARRMGAAAGRGPATGTLRPEGDFYEGVDDIFIYAGSVRDQMRRGR